jgi:hypothetical protein
VCSPAVRPLLNFVFFQTSITAFHDSAPPASPGGLSGAARRHSSWRVPARKERQGVLEGQQRGVGDVYVRSVGKFEGRSGTWQLVGVLPVAACCERHTKSQGTREACRTNPRIVLKLYSCFRAAWVCSWSFNCSPGEGAALLLRFTSEPGGGMSDNRAERCRSNL